MDSKSESTAVQMLTNYLKDNRMRRTPERFAILKAIYSISGCFTLEDLLEVMEKEEKFRVSRATMYNTLNVFVNANLVVRHQFDKQTKYSRSLDDGKVYLVCTKCGTVTEMYGVDLAGSIGKIKKFYPINYALYIYGMCSKCLQAQRRRRKINEKKITKK